MRKVLTEALWSSIPVAALIYIAMACGDYESKQPMDTIIALSVFPFCYLAALITILVLTKQDSRHDN